MTSWLTLYFVPKLNETSWRSFPLNIWCGNISIYLNLIIAPVTLGCASFPLKTWRLNAKWPYLLMIYREESCLLISSLQISKKRLSYKLWHHRNADWPDWYSNLKIWNCLVLLLNNRCKIASYLQGNNEIISICPLVTVLLVIVGWVLISYGSVSISLFRCNL